MASAKADRRHASLCTVEEIEMTKKALQQTLSAELSSSLQAAFKDAIEQAMSGDEVTELVNDFVDDWLKDRDCWLSFRHGKPEALIGFGEIEAADSFDVTVSIDDYMGIGGPYEGDQSRYVQEQIDGIDAFINEMMQRRQDLVEALKHKQKFIKE